MTRRIPSLWFLVVLWFMALVCGVAMGTGIVIAVELIKKYLHL